MTNTIARNNMDASPEPTAVEKSPRSKLDSFDLLLVGGGLANGLIALASLARHPQRTVALVEREDQLGGNHTWCLHPHDAPPESLSWLSPLLSHRWRGYDVMFPNLNRTLRGEYAAVTSERFDRVVKDAIAASPGSRCFRGQAATEVSETRVVLESGRRLHASLVVDARGPERIAPRDGCGFQKFVGLELDFARPHGLARPRLMDATVAQRDGFRFMYVLPLGPERLLVEDTVFSHRPELHHAQMRASALAYAARFGKVSALRRSEQGVLPMPWKPAAPMGGAPPLRAGFAGGYFHPATGYSFPAALRLAMHVADRSPEAAIGPDLARLQRDHRSQARYAERLNWLLFHCFEPEDMRNVFERFYRMPEPLIHRFYAMAMTRSDRVRLLLGNPPRGISLAAALGRAPRVRTAS